MPRPSVAGEDRCCARCANGGEGREYSLAASLIAASCATLTEIGFVVSWFHNGGGPHGMEPSPGLWKTLGPIFGGTLLTSVALAILEKGNHESTS
jgi:hypothetical protein